MSLGGFIEIVNPSLYHEYRVDMFRENNPGHVSKQVDVDKNLFKTSTVLDVPMAHEVLRDSERLDSLDPSHDAVRYIREKRRLGDNVLNRLWFVEDIRLIAHRIERYRDIDIRSVVRAVVIPFMDETGTKISYVQCRSIDPDVSESLRYITLEVDESAPKIFGLDHVDWSKHVWITEGPFDALIVPNTISVAGISLLSENKYISDRAKAGFTFVFDRDYQSNYQVYSQLKKAVDDGQSVLLYNNAFPGKKDLNDAIVAGWSVNQLEQYMTSRRRSGLTAKLDLSTFKAPLPNPDRVIRKR